MCAAGRKKKRCQRAGEEQGLFLHACHCKNKYSKSSMPIAFYEWRGIVQ
jgi:hypothetical protein